MTMRTTLRSSVWIRPGNTSKYVEFKPKILIFSQFGSWRRHWRQAAASEQFPREEVQEAHRLQPEGIHWAGTGRVAAIAWHWHEGGGGGSDHSEQGQPESDQAEQWGGGERVQCHRRARLMSLFDRKLQFFYWIILFNFILRKFFVNYLSFFCLISFYLFFDEVKKKIIVVKLWKCHVMLFFLSIFSILF